MWAKVIMETGRETSNGKDCTWTGWAGKGKAGQKRYLSTFGLKTLRAVLGKAPPR